MGGWGVGFSLDVPRLSKYVRVGGTRRSLHSASPTRRVPGTLPFTLEDDDVEDGNTCRSEGTVYVTKGVNDLKIVIGGVL